MFQALEEANNGGHNTPKSARKVDPSIGSKEIDILNKQFQEQMAERVKDLELQLMTKE